ncbi:MAG: C45 family autoproteolytic acyltransferase/hydrolase [Acidobacteriaceae bacterium]
MSSRSLTTVVLIALCAVAFWMVNGVKAASKPQQPDVLKNAWRFERGGWIYVHLEGAPHDIGFQHGGLLAPEIDKAFQAIRYHDTTRTKRDWNFFHDTAKNILWPHIDEEYRQELQGIADGLNAKGVKMDVYDVVALNAFEEVPDYYIPWLEKQQHAQLTPGLVAPGNCSAFVATGSFTKDGKPVIAHNNWTSVISGAHWRIIFDIVPKTGHHIIMDGFPGIITSDDDFGVNDAGLAITETTITQFEGFDPNGKPEFMRARKAMQYATSIDEYVNIMLDGNNGGYANDWLLADYKTGEIARFEEGLKHHRVWRTKDGYLVGSNFPSDPDLIRDEAPEFDVKNMATSPNARKVRWEQLMTENKGKIDAAMAQRFLADHYDSYEKKIDPNERTLCGHVEDSPRGIPEWGWDKYHPGGTMQGKAMDASMQKNMTFVARYGHSCGGDFIAATFLKAHPEYDWQKPYLQDMKAGPWTQFKAGEKK